MFEEFFGKLKKDEQETVQRWIAGLPKDITVEGIKEFCQIQIRLLIAEINPDNSEKKDLFIKSQLRLFQLLLDFIESPERAKEQLEAYLKSLKI